MHPLPLPHALIDTLTGTLADALPSTLTALRALPGAALRSAAPHCPPPLRQALHAGRRAALVSTRLAWYAALGALVLLAPRVQAQTGDAPKAESPYFFVQGAQPGVDALPLKSTEVQVRISGVIAQVQVTQRYKNEGAVPIEAKYLFPGSTRAAVHGLDVRVGQRLIAAHIREKQQARVEYDQARQAGQTAALLEQHRPNVFQMHVANILPGDEVQVQLRYNELLVPEDGRYQFVYPTVVGPRYAGSAAGADGANGADGAGHAAAQAAAFPAQPVLRQGQASGSAFDLHVQLDSPVDIAGIQSPSHAIDTVLGEGGNTRRARVRLAASASRAAGNRDFVLDYRLAGSAIQSGVLLHRGEKENYFLAMVQPPKAVAPAQITPRDYVFVVDVSGSMHGFPLDTAKALMRALLGGLRASDTFNVMLFSGASRMLAPESVPATPANVNAAIRTIEQMGGGGSTELLPALRRVLAAPKPPGLARTVVVVTDGYVTVERDAFALVRQHLSQANVFAFGIGSSVNRHLMEGLARAGMGEPFIVTRPSEAAAQAARFQRMIASPVLTSVQAQFDGLPVYDVEPPALPDLLAERPLIVMGKWREPAPGATPTLRVQGQAADGPFTQTLPIDTRADWQGTSALRQLWARQRIATLSDEEALTGDSTHRAAITQLGLAHSLLTDYTSFIAIDRVVRNPGGPSASAEQPSPMPEGVSDLAAGQASALGAAVSSTPEPEALGAALIVLAVLGAAMARRPRRQPLTA
ncbi:MAG: VIT domain-containing protein [Pseudomonadota bacterium]|nr:VIT domain-containing protein [Pseudomonadota bacterium]